jgi:hypothetical protein
MQPSTQPTEQPSRQPTRQPTGQPSRVPTSQPTAQPSRVPTAQPSRQPTQQPTNQPSNQPTQQPTVKPTVGSQGVSVARAHVTPSPRNRFDCGSFGHASAPAEGASVKPLRRRAKTPRLVLFTCRLR